VSDTTSVKVEDLSGGVLDWAVAFATSEAMPTVWQWLEWDSFRKREFDTYATTKLMHRHAVALEPTDPFTEGGGEWWATCVNADGERCRYLGDTPLIAGLRAIVGAQKGAEIDIPNKILEHYA